MIQPSCASVMSIEHGRVDMGASVRSIPILRCDAMGFTFHAHGQTYRCIRNLALVHSDAEDLPTGLCAIQFSVAQSETSASGRFADMVTSTFDPAWEQVLGPVQKHLLVRPLNASACRLGRP